MTPAQSDLIAALGVELESLDRIAGRRHLVAPQGIDVASNDYLGLGADLIHRQRVVAAIRRRAREGSLAAPASRLLRGTDPAHLDLETRIAAWKGAEAALLCASGYQANLALLSALIGRHDRVISDALNHASLIDGIRMSRAAKEIVPHGDLEAFESVLREPWPAGRTWVVVESLYSMDGDALPLDQISDLADRYDALLIVDDAHATGLFGDTGSGLIEHFGVAADVTACVTTFGKALAATGAAITGPRVVIDYLINRARPFIFSTALSPLVLAAIEVGLDEVRDAPERRHRALAAAARLRETLRRAGLDVPGGPGPIVPVILGSNASTLAVAAALQVAGFDARAIRPPTVPEGRSRIRFSIHGDHDDGLIDRLAAATIRAVAETEAIATQPSRHGEKERE